MNWSMYYVLLLKIKFLDRHTACGWFKGGQREPVWNVIWKVEVTDWHLTFIGLGLSMLSVYNTCLVVLNVSCEFQIRCCEIVLWAIKNHTKKSQFIKSLTTVTSSFPLKSYTFILFVGFSLSSEVNEV